MTGAEHEPDAVRGEHLVLLRAAGTCLLVDARGTDLPDIVYWGSDLGDLGAADLSVLSESTRAGVPSNSLDRPSRVGLLPEHATGYAGRATLDGSGADESRSPIFGAARTERATEPDGTQVLRVTASDRVAGLELHSQLRLAPSGVVTLRHAVTNTADAAYTLGSLPAVLPLPDRAREILDLTGRHTRERSPQRMPLHLGAWVREQRRGRTGHDAPLVLAVGTPGFGFRSGEVWAVHLAWSGNGTTFAERLPDGWACLGGGELVQPGEIVLAKGQTYTAPTVFAAYSAHGLDGISAGYHDLVRARASHPTGPRPVILNTWEAVYFDHKLDRLEELADRAAEVGVERFVLDDGWFGGRRADTAGLGDWFVSPDAWPGGLHPIVDRVRELGMEFGLWVEPEMVNPDSDLARAHPDWLMSMAGRTPPSARNQQVLDIAHPAAYAHILDSIDKLLQEYAISYLKWDHNRDLVDAAHTFHGRSWPGVHRQTSALYRLLDELRRRHPTVEIESCAGGGGRADLGILARTDRIWASDCNDPLERQQIQLWTNLLLPYELVGAHVGPPRAHTTHRVSDLAFRAGTALFGHLGIEWDLTSAGPEELADLTRWVRLYKELRGLLHSGRVVRADSSDPSTLVHGVVAPDGSQAVFAYVQLTTGVGNPPAPIRLPGLDPRRTYRVAVVDSVSQPRLVGVVEPAWWRHGEVTLPGSALSEAGLAAPMLAPEQLALLRVTAV